MMISMYFYSLASTLRYNLETKDRMEDGHTVRQTDRLKSIFPTGDNISFNNGCISIVGCNKKAIEDLIEAKLNFCHRVQ